MAATCGGRLLTCILRLLGGRRLRCGRGRGLRRHILFRPGRGRLACRTCRALRAVSSTRFRQNATCRSVRFRRTCCLAR